MRFLLCLVYAPVFIEFIHLKKFKNIIRFVLVLLFICSAVGSSSFAGGTCSRCIGGNERHISKGRPKGGPKAFLHMPDELVQMVRDSLDFRSVLALDQVDRYQQSNPLKRSKKLLSNVLKDVDFFECKSAFECKKFCRFPSSRKVKLNFSEDLDSFFKDQNCHPFIEEIEFGHRVSISKKIDLASFTSLKTLNMLGTSNYFEITRLPRSLEVLKLDQFFIPISPQMLAESQLKMLAIKDSFGTLRRHMRNLPATLENLDLSGSNGNLKLKYFKYLKNLKVLNMSGCDLSSKDLGDPPPSLEKLKISSNHEITHLGLLSKLKHLRVLDASFCRLTSDGIKDLPLFLEKLNLQYNDSLKDLRNLPRLIHLKELNVRSCNLRFEQIQNLPVSLEGLNISEGKGITDYQSLSKLSQLKELVAIRCNFNSQQLENLPTSLERLFLNLNKDITSLNEIRHLTQLVHLRASYCDLKANGITNLPTSLKNVGLGGNRNLVDLRGLSNLVQLEYLDAVVCGLTPEGIQNLPPSITKIHLDYNPLLR